ncbi:Cytochrome P450 2U1 [Armadillidium nasatum]|uniref:Cytochrome P450 2U1 n=1 Tax=Armadillidium nasatum TaxID=96803 RepID=A0A5N5T9Z0_9CRUS|nr:Cytochrome P450 2U1 [Armadillidium nasatum]
MKCKYDFRDERVHIFMKKFGELEKSSILIFFADFFPIVKYIIPKPVLSYLTGRPVFERICQDFENLVQPFIEDHLRTLDPNNPRDLMDDYLIEMNEKRNSNYSHFDITDLTRITIDLFVAGNDTTANITWWVLIYMARFQEIQEKIQKEIDRSQDVTYSLKLNDKFKCMISLKINLLHSHFDLFPNNLEKCKYSALRRLFILKDSKKETATKFYFSFVYFISKKFTHIYIIINIRNFHYFQIDFFIWMPLLMKFRGIAQ